MSVSLPNTKRVLKGIYQKLEAPEIVISVAVTALSIVAASLLVKEAFTVTGDAVCYWDMAQLPISPDNEWWWGNVPFTYRILIPFVVRNFFDSSLTGFIFVTTVSLLVSNYLVFKISQLYTNDILASSFLVITFSTNFTIFTVLVSPALVDLPSFVFMLVLAFIFLRYIIREKAASKTVWLLYSTSLLVAALIKEQIFFVLPVLFIYLLYTRKTKEAVLLFFYSFPAIGAHLTVRLIMGPLFPEIQNPSLALLIERYFSFSIGAYRALFATFGAIWLVIPLALFYSYRSNRAMKETYIPVILAFIIALAMCTTASDHNRYLFFIAFPFLIPALSTYFAKCNSYIKKGALYTVTTLFLLTRLAMHYRPESQDGFAAPTAGQSEAVILLISVAAVIQILVMLYYVVAASDKISLPGSVQKAV